MVPSAELSVLRDWKVGDKFDVNFPDFKSPLRNYQKVAAAYAYLSRNCVLGDPTGVGKTMEALGVANLMYNHDHISKALIVTPYSVFQWQSEIDKFLGWSSIVMQANTRKKRQGLWSESRSNFFSICNYHTLVSDLEKIKDCKFPLIIFDECTAFKNSDTTRFRTIYNLSRSLLQTKGSIIGLSATPMEGRFEDLWSIFSGLGVNLGTLENYISRFCTVKEFNVYIWKRHPRLIVSGPGRICPSCSSSVFDPYIECKNCKTSFKWKKSITKVTGCSDPETLRSMIDNHVIMRPKAELLPELPPLTLKNVILPFDKDQRKHYNDLAKDEAMTLNGMVLARFQQEICVHPGLMNKKGKSPKLEWLKEALQTEFYGKKVVVYSNYIFMMRQILDLAKSLDLSPVYIAGQHPNGKAMTQEQKIHARDEFTNNPHCNLLVGTTAIEKSWNLQIAGTIITIDQIPNPARLSQLYGRIERMGSTHANISAINLMMEDSVETEYWAIVEEKVGNVQDIFGLQSMNMDLTQELVRRRSQK